MGAAVPPWVQRPLFKTHQNLPLDRPRRARAHTGTVTRRSRLEISKCGFVFTAFRATDHVKVVVRQRLVHVREFIKCCVTTTPRHYTVRNGSRRPSARFPFNQKSPYKTSVDSAFGAQDVFGSACVFTGVRWSFINAAWRGLVDLVAYRACFAARRQTPRLSQTCSLVTFSPKSLHL